MKRFLPELQATFYIGKNYLQGNYKSIYLFTIQNKLPFNYLPAVVTPSLRRKEVYSAANTHFQKEQGQAVLACPQPLVMVTKMPPVLQKLTP